MRLREAAEVVCRRWSRAPRVGIVLGTGLGRFVEAVAVEEEFRYADLPHFPHPTALGHAGRLIVGRIGNVPVAVLQGRSHFYEGRPAELTTFPVRLLRHLGTETLILSCAAGGLAAGLSVGDLLAIVDHVDLLFRRPFAAFSSYLGAESRCEDATGMEPSPGRGTPIYDPDLIEQVQRIARGLNIPMFRGTYIAVTGPNYETRAELRFLRKLGDAIGMSTVPEAVLGRRLGMRVCGMATMTNLCNPELSVVADGKHVLDAAAEAEPRFRAVVVELLQELEAARSDAAFSPEKSGSAPATRR